MVLNEAPRSNQPGLEVKPKAFFHTTRLCEPPAFVLLTGNDVSSRRTAVVRVAAHETKTDSSHVVFVGI